MERMGKPHKFGSGIAKKIAAIVIAGFLAVCVREFGKEFGLMPQNIGFVQDALITIASLVVAYILIWIASR